MPAERCRTTCNTRVELALCLHSILNLDLYSQGYASLSCTLPPQKVYIMPELISGFYTQVVCCPAERSAARSKQYPAHHNKLAASRSIQRQAAAGLKYRPCRSLLQTLCVCSGRAGHNRVDSPSCDNQVDGLQSELVLVRFIQQEASQLPSGCASLFI